MKRTLALILLFLLMLQAVSCIHLTTPLPDRETTDSESSADSSAEPPDQPPPAVPVWSSAEDAAADFFESTEDSIVNISRREYSYTEMEADLALLKETYPAHFSYRTFGTSVAGRSLYVAVLGNPNASRQILVSAGIHGREYLTPLLVMKQMEFYLRYYDSGEYGGVPYARLFEDCCFYIVPMTNPDGIMLSQAGLDTLTDPQLRAKVQSVYEADFSKGYTSQADIDEYLKYWKANANGVDLNRNFDALWEEYRMGEKVPCHKNYKGETAASEPETRAMVELTDSLSNPAAVLCIHSQGEVLYWNCGQDENLRTRTQNFTQELANRTGYELIQEQNNDASLSDWCALERGLIAVTVETGSGTCPLYIDKFEAIWFDCFDLLPLAASYFEH